MTATTYLYVPGDTPARFGKALRSGTDAVVLDLEDAVVAARKDEARELVARWVAACDPAGVELWVRVNPGELGERDIRAVAAPELTGIWLPKVESALEVEEAGRVLADCGAGHARISALVETAAGLLALPEIARAAGIRFLQLGEVDLAADLGIEIDDSAEQLLFARSQVVTVSAAAGIEPPVAAVSVNFTDPTTFEAETRRLRRLGFAGRACIHPRQLAPVRDVFTPTPAEVGHAEDILHRLAAAPSGVGVDARGHLIDEAVARSARRTVARAPRPGPGSGP
ncbi:HpcH/HpaI aldolase/citrate lyase family protein [Nocardia jinanensis]|uniref:Citryl-CoA lyase n=1 Tax=Nocardia jinanensis TaxID=382504 RepID=A0A917VJF8_9NOCA|nr:CoA ester lyase [Nocardia jinanensis]GGK90302.1 citryl-CoA lyase [Nocardia jinanensis]